MHFTVVRRLTFFLMEHRSHINKIKVTFVLLPGKVGDILLRLKVSEEEREVKIHHQV